MLGARRRCVERAGGCPTVRTRIVSPTGVEKAREIPSTAPDDHLTACPDCRVIISSSGCINGGSVCPCVRAGIISPASVETAKTAAPDNHLTASPHCRVAKPLLGCIGGGYPTIKITIISTARVRQIAVVSAPNDHFTASPDGGVQLSAGWCARRARSNPAICGGIVPPTRIEKARVSRSAPHDHLITGPDRRVIVSSDRRINSAGGCPIVYVRIVSSTSIETVAKAITSTPDDHFTAGPNSCM